jgi:hypothetical protein
MALAAANAPNASAANFEMMGEARGLARRAGSCICFDPSSIDVYPFLLEQILLARHIAMK